MRGIYFFLPGISEKYQSGGLRVTLQTRSFFQSIFPESLCETVTTHEKVDGAMYAPDFFAAEKMMRKHPGDAADGETLCVVTWGPLVAEHIREIKKNLPHTQILFYAQSFGWNVDVPAGIPIICVSRFVMSQWALHAKGNFVGYVPPSLSEVFYAPAVASRDIDILVHTRKQNSYCLTKLLPALQEKGLVCETIDSWINQGDFAQLLKRTKIFLYVTELHKAGFFRKLPGEGFGLPALEALASGCMVASNLLGGVSDFLTPGINCIKVETGNVARDVHAIQHALHNFIPLSNNEITDHYSKASVLTQWRMILKNLYGHS